MYYIDCPYNEKEIVKEIGGRWDPHKKKWYFTNKNDVEKFKPWLSTEQYNDIVKTIDKRDKRRESILMNNIRLFAKEIVLERYKSGKTITEISREFNMINSTIENCLIFLMMNGDLNVRDFLSEEDEKLIEKVVKENYDGRLKRIKDLLENKFSYLQIRIVMRKLKLL